MNMVALVIHGFNANSAYVDDHSGSRLPSLHRATAVRMMGHDSRGARMRGEEKRAKAR
jgi:hypothetical protein